MLQLPRSDNRGFRFEEQANYSYLPTRFRRLTERQRTKVLGTEVQSPADMQSEAESLRAPAPISAEELNSGFEAAFEQAFQMPAADVAVGGFMDALLHGAFDLENPALAPGHQPALAQPPPNINQHLAEGPQEEFDVAAIVHGTA